MFPNTAFSAALAEAASWLARQFSAEAVNLEQLAARLRHHRQSEN